MISAPLMLAWSAFAVKPPAASIAWRSRFWPGGKDLKTWIVHLTGDVYNNPELDPGVGNTISTEPVSRQASGRERRARTKGIRRRRSWASLRGMWIQY